MKLLSLFAGAALAEFNAHPTGGERPCNFYTFKATAVFDNGFTEDVGAAMHNGADQVYYKTTNGSAKF